jgi:hypothetical protein
VVVTQASVLAVIGLALGIPLGFAVGRPSGGSRLRPGRILRDE